MKNNQKQFENQRYDQDNNPKMANHNGLLNIDNNQRNNEPDREADNRMETGKHASQLGKKHPRRNDNRINDKTHSFFQIF